MQPPPSSLARMQQSPDCLKLRTSIAARFQHLSVVLEMTALHLARDATTFQCDGYTFGHYSAFCLAIHAEAMLQFGIETIALMRWESNCCDEVDLATKKPQRANVVLSRGLLDRRAKGDAAREVIQ